MQKTVIDKLYDDYLDLLSYLQDNREISLLNDADNNFKKVLVISSASFFEHEITQILIQFINKYSNNNIKIFSFTKRKAIDYQYHTYFDWDAKNVNKFLSLFGDEFKEVVKKDSKSNEQLEKAIQDFIRIGSTRNRLAHENFANFTLDMTSKDIYELYGSAKLFIDYLAEKLS